MEKSHARLKGILKLEERLLADLMKALPLVSGKDTRFLLREIVRAKRGHIRIYKATMRKSEKTGTQLKNRR